MNWYNSITKLLLYSFIVSSKMQCWVWIESKLHHSKEIKLKISEQLPSTSYHLFPLTSSFLLGQRNQHIQYYVPCPGVWQPVSSLNVSCQSCRDTSDMFTSHVYSVSRVCLSAEHTMLLLKGFAHNSLCAFTYYSVHSQCAFCEWNTVHRRQGVCEALAWRHIVSS